MHDLTVHPLELRAERAGKSIDLSPREASILTLLHERAGQVVDRDTLLDRCWGVDYFPESRTLDMQIAKLRKHIESGSGAPTIIETVRGAGYRYRPVKAIAVLKPKAVECLGDDFTHSHCASWRRSVRLSG
jgi:DNA-binding response OmpR family regulator